MEELSRWWSCALAVQVASIVFLIIVALEQNRPDQATNMVGVLIAFTLGITLAEITRIRSEEKRSESIKKDFITELKEIVEKAAAEECGPFYSETWAAIKGAGIPDRIEPRLRKAFAGAFLDMEIYNEDIRRYEDYTILPNCVDDTAKVLKTAAESARSTLIMSAQKVLDMV